MATRKLTVNPGDVFGRLTILEELPHEPHTPRKVLAKCSCPEAVVKDYLLKLVISGHTKSCGCWNRDRQKFIKSYTVEMPEPGIVFGRLTVQRMSDNTNEKYGRLIVCSCACDTDKEIEVVAYWLLAGKVKSCGCLVSGKTSQRALNAQEAYNITEYGRMCSRCEVWKPWGDFYKSPVKKALTGHVGHCTECAKKLTITRNFKITVEEYEGLIRLQDSKCALCKEPEPKDWHGAKSYFHIDHDHACCPGRSLKDKSCIRGALCMFCNFMLAGVERNTELFATPVVKEYLEKRPFRKSWIGS